MSRSKIVWFICGMVFLPFLLRDTYRIVTVPRLSAQLPAPFAIETVRGFRNAHPRVYAAEMTDITVGNRQESERWYTDRTGYFHTRDNGRRESKFGKRINTYSMELDDPNWTAPGSLPSTHCFTFKIPNMHDLPVGIAFGDDNSNGAKAQRVNSSVHSVIEHGRGLQYKDASWEQKDFYLVGRYNIPKTTTHATIALGIATRNNAVLYGETPMPGWWGRKTGADLALRLDLPHGSRMYPNSHWRDEMVSLIPPSLPGDDQSLPPYAFAVYAVTPDGREHVMREFGDAAGEGRDIGYVCDTIPRRNIYAIRVLIAPYFWTRFEDVPLRWR